MSTPEHGRRTPTNARRLAATASLAAAGIVGATVGSTPANAAVTTAGSAAPATPVAKLVANHSGVTSGHPVTFTVTERTRAGAAVASARARFYVHTKAGWKYVSTKALSAGGSATFTFTPTVTHRYQIDLSAVSAAGTKIYDAVNTPSVTVVAKPADIGPAIVAAAAKEKGRPYAYGAAGPHSFDCSGLVKYVYGRFGIALPHQANSQKRYGTRVSAKNVRPGDLVFVMSGSYATHVAIYAGKGTWWEAPHSGASVRHVKIWSKHVEYRRVR